MLSRPGCEGHGDGSGKPGLLGAVRPGRVWGGPKPGVLPARAAAAWMCRGASMTKPLQPRGMLTVRLAFPASLAATCRFAR